VRCFGSPDLYAISLTTQRVLGGNCFCFESRIFSQVLRAFSITLTSAWSDIQGVFHIRVLWLLLAWKRIPFIPSVAPKRFEELKSLFSAIFVARATCFKRLDEISFNGVILFKV